MKQHGIVIIVTVLILALFPKSQVFAQGPSGNWVSGITCQNMDSVNAADVTFEFFQEGQSSAALTYPDSIPAGGTLKYFTPNTPSGLPSPFNGSARISSNRAVSCNVNTQANNAGTEGAPFRVGTSAGYEATQTGPIAYVPQVIKQSGTAPIEWNSYIAIQNTTSSSVSIDVQYYDRFSGNEITAAKESRSIPANSSVVVYQKSNANLPIGFNGGAKVVATNPNTTPLAVTVNFYNSGSSYSTSQFHSYNGFSVGSNKLYIPRVIRRYYGYNSGLSIQNVGVAPTTVTIDFTFKDGTTYSYNSPTIQPSASLILYTPGMATLAAVDSKPMGNRAGSAIVTTANPADRIVGIINDDNRGDPTDNNGVPVPIGDIGKGSTVGMFLDGQQTNNVFISQMTKKAAGGVYTGGIIIQNTTNLAGTCDLTFAGVPGATMTGVNLPINGLISLYTGTQVPGLPDGFNASVSINCTRPVFGIANFSAEAAANKYGDSYIQYNAFNK